MTKPSGFLIVIYMATMGNIINIEAFTQRNKPKILPICRRWRDRSTVSGSLVAWLWHGNELITGTSQIKILIKHLKNVIKMLMVEVDFECYLSFRSCRFFGWSGLEWIGNLDEIPNGRAWKKRTFAVVRDRSRPISIGTGRRSANLGSMTINII
jgi:hypothetical protein